MEMGRLVVSVVIPHYNDLSNLIECLKLLNEQTLDRETYEIIVADNNSEMGIDAIRKVVRGAANVIQASEQGAGPARNAGVAVANGKILGFIDSDCRPAPDWLEKGVAALITKQVIGGRVEVLIEHRKKLRPTEAFEAIFAFDNKAYVEKKEFSVTANLFCRKSVFDKVGGFQSSVSEDFDWCLRAKSCGYELGYADNVIVRHPPRKTWADLAKKWQRLTRESYLLTKNRPFGRMMWVARSWLVLFSPILHFIIVMKSQKLHGFGNKTKAIAVLFGIRTYRFVYAHKVLLEFR